ncbi:MAG: hypothetical protein Q8M15_10580 [Bacteroidota bacterium]|nr:hypothetical protein [Bacteroidota bacterium]
MKSKDEKAQNTFEEDYTEIMKSFQLPEIPFNQAPQWLNPNDFIIKFSLFEETPNSITSTDTLVYPGY